MNIENNTFLDVKKIPESKLSFRMVADVLELPTSEVQVTYTDGTNKALPARTPKAPRNVTGARIVQGILLVDLDDATTLTLGRVDQHRLVDTIEIFGEGILIHPEDRQFKKLQSSSPVVVVTETPEKHTLQFVAPTIAPSAPFADGLLTTDRLMQTSKVYTELFSGGSWYIGAADATTGWNTALPGDITYKGVDLTATVDPAGEITLPAGHYYIDYIVPVAASGNYSAELYNVTLATTILTSMGGATTREQTGTFNQHNHCIIRGEFYLPTTTVVKVRVKDTVALIYFGNTYAFPGITKSMGGQMSLWKVSDAQLTFPALPPVRVSEWQGYHDVYDPATTYTPVEETLDVGYNVSVDNLYIGVIKAPTGCNYYIPDTSPTFLYTTDDHSVMKSLPNPVITSGGYRPFGKHSTVGPNGRIYVPAYNAKQHVQIVPMPEGGYVRPSVLDALGEVKGYNYFSRPVALHDPHVAVTAPAAVSGHGSVLLMLQNSKYPEKKNNYLSIPTDTPEVSLTFRLPTTLKELVISMGQYAPIESGKVYSVTLGVRTELGDLIVDGNVVRLVIAPTAVTELVIVVSEASGEPGAIQFGFNGIQLIVEEQLDLAKFEGVVELIPGAANSTISTKYEIARSCGDEDEIMFIPVANYLTRGGLEFYTPSLKMWRKSGYGVNVPSTDIFSAAIYSPISKDLFIFTRGATGGNYAYNTVTKSLKKLPTTNIGVDVVVNAPNGDIYGFVSNSSNALVINPITHMSTIVPFDVALNQPTEFTKVIVGKEGLVHLFAYSGIEYVVDLTLKTVTVIPATSMWTLQCRKLNGDYILFPSRKLTGQPSLVTTYVVRQHSEGTIPNPLLQWGPYVN